MQGFELTTYIESCLSFKNHFKGVYSINTMPTVLQKRQFYFTNIDLNSGSGSHWICILKNDNNELELFDSLGNTETKIEWFLKYCHIRSKSKLVYNVTPVQSIYSNSCGKFVLYFAIKRLFNIDMSFSKLINQIFEDNVDENETIVKAFISDFNNYGV